MRIERNIWSIALCLVVSGVALGGPICVIDGQNYSAGALNPANDCQACFPSQSTFAWSPRPEGAVCGNPSSSQCDNPDACDGVGACEPNHKPDGIPCGDASACTTDDQCETGQCLGELVPGVPAVNAAHSRAVDVEAAPSGDPVPFALRVTAPLDFPCLLKWVSADGTLVDAPVYQSSAAWGVIRVSGPEIVPGATYEIASECDGLLSAQGSDDTPIWGDLNDTGAVDVDDILCMLDAFSGIFVNCVEESVDLDPCDGPNGLIDVSDILLELDAFIGVPFPCPLPCN